ncbi:signal-regulatory protein beta-2-like [Gracilinanus agilis]|uniref:signal-regulatory protein beta-2-like n=1 Tax=Gracilinanus agilis TaxID=191870 RepID=UPI001CFD60AE|nr:signal-regulatory protein beta-2-like [Gracilinanus agilis]
MSSLLYVPGSSLPLLLTVLLGLSGTQGQEAFQVLQPKDPVSVAKGETVTLNCTITDISLPGPVKWFKGAGPQRKEIYNFKGGIFPRIKAVAPSTSTTDYSINISNITPEDTGTYYCVKFKKGNPDTEFKSGGGTMLSVSDSVWHSSHRQKNRKYKVPITMPSPIYLRGSTLPSLLLTLLLGLSGTQGQEELQVLQPDSVTVTEGETATLNCTISDISLPGPAIWFKGAGPQRKEIYNFKGGIYPRIKATAPSTSATDFSISISSITLEDTGTYYCVKFKKGNPDTEFKSGGGTKLIVRVPVGFSSNLEILLVGATTISTTATMTTVIASSPTHWTLPRSFLH